MRHIDRIEKPRILKEKELMWTQKFIKSGNKRPHNEQYGHNEIRDALCAMSFHKCFYCERTIKETKAEIDHYIEVNEDKTLAFKWTNLYLAYENCNNKLPNKTIPANKALDPCSNTDEEIKEHITFIDEQITANNNSELGFKTIQKFRLNTQLLDLLRSRQLHLFKNVLIKIQYLQNKDGGRPINQIEKQSLIRFAQKDQQFSLMFKNILKKYGLMS